MAGAVQYGHAERVIAFTLTPQDIRDLRLSKEYVARAIESGIMIVEEI